jgi:hypothetical protein
VVPAAKNAALPLWPQSTETMWGTEAELFDILADPRERVNVAGQNAKTLVELRRELDRWWRVD